MKDRVPVICKLNEGIFSSRGFFSSSEMREEKSLPTMAAARI